ncbi:T/G mismatch-specific endonuclease [Phyllobacterium sp. YR620]|nr:DNA mismatch endonuclease Vsr [Phyllobacterium sp. YR620]SDP77342.1 T/G mismatch-specific endonuclease [Phyllobacterium sp. YR620]
MDIVDKPTRSRMMSGIRGTNTAPERALRRTLHGLGLRFRLHGKLLPGKPDIVSRRYRALIYVHGCFWHRHTGCRFATTPKTREEFWRTKFEGNVRRDAKVRDEALRLGWRVATVWECSLRKPGQIEISASAVMEWLKSGCQTLEIGAPISEVIECSSA